MTPREERERDSVREFRIHVAQVVITVVVVLTILAFGWVSSAVHVIYV